MSISLVSSVSNQSTSNSSSQVASIKAKIQQENSSKDDTKTKQAKIAQLQSQLQQAQSQAQQAGLNNTQSTSSVSNKQVQPSKDVASNSSNNDKSPNKNIIDELA